MLVFSHQTITKCLYTCSTSSAIIKQTDSIVLATSDNLKCYTYDQQCRISVHSFIFLSVLYGNNRHPHSTHASALMADTILCGKYSTLRHSHAKYNKNISCTSLLNESDKTDLLIC